MATPHEPSHGLTSRQRALLWQAVNDPPGEPPFPRRGALARRGGVEAWELADRDDEHRWRQREEADDRWRVWAIDQVRQGLA